MQNTKKKKSANVNQNLVDEARRAKELHLSYGQYQIYKYAKAAQSMRQKKPSGK